MKSQEPERSERFIKENLFKRIKKKKISYEIKKKYLHEICNFQEIYFDIRSDTNNKITLSNLMNLLFV